MIKRKRLLALILSLSLTFSSVLTVSAAGEAGQDTSNVVVQDVDQETQDESEQQTPEADSESDSEVESDEVTYEGEVASSYNQDEANPVAVDVEDTEIDASVWTVEDFTYTSYEKELYGCDYSRIFTIKGSAIAGFSETGLAKLAKNTDVVLPSVDDEGDALVGVAPSAFKSMGLTSVTFPSGMMVDYNDTVTNGKITKRGNFVIAEDAFSGNKLTSVTLPEGVIACLSNSFMSNQITTVKLPKTIWWLETQSFARNKITTVNFPTTCDFQLELHGMPFGQNLIKSVRLPDYTEVVNKDSFVFNPGMEPLADEAPSKYKTYTIDGTSYTSGVVYMYTDNAELEVKDRIHHIGKETASQKSYVQKLVINDGTPETENPDLPWNVNDFTFDGQTVTGLSESGIAKRATNKDLVIPDFTREGMYVTEIAAGKAGGNGLFATEEEGFDTVYLPSGLQKIGDFAFQASGLKEVTFPARLAEIGSTAFQNNNLTSVILPDTVTKLGAGAFSTNPKLERISLSKGLTEIPNAAFGCSDAKNYMSNLKSIVIPEGITKIGDNAFAGNNFAQIVIPSTVTEIGKYAFSTKEYLTDPCTLVLPEGLTKIGNRAFRNKVIEEVVLPTTVTKLESKTFERTQSKVVTKVYVSSKAQYEDTKNFPSSTYHKLYLTDEAVWTAEDFVYGEEEYTIYPAAEYSTVPNFKAHVVTGFSEQGLEKFATNKNLVIPAKDPNGKKIQGVGKNAFNLNELNKVQKENEKAEFTGIETLTLPENVKTSWDDSTWETSGKGVKERGDFFIGNGAFRYNQLTSLELPEGVFYLHMYAFANNTKLSYVKLPQTLMMIFSGAFYTCGITTVDFPEKTDFNFNIDANAFSKNQIKAVQLPSNTEKVGKGAFVSNTGMEPVTNGTNTAEKNSGLVYMYKTEAGGNYIAHADGLGSMKSVVQKLIIGTMPKDLSPWGAEDFTYDEAGTTITGLTDSGKEKIKSNANLILPKEGPSGKAITALGTGSSGKGIFTVTADGKNYTPANVQLPETLEVIGGFAFAVDGSASYEAAMTSIVLPEGLKEIGTSAFQNSKLTSVSIPDSVSVMGSGTFTGSGDLTSVKLSANVTEIPMSAFGAGAATNMKLTTLVIPEGVTSIGRSAFMGAHVETVTFPSTLVSIGETAFQNHQMTELEIPGNVKSVGKNAFTITQASLTKKLTKLTLHEGLETIGQYAFVGNAIKEVEIPSTLVLSAKDKAADCIFGKKNGAANPIVKLRTADKSKVDAYNTAFANDWSHIVVYDKLAGTGWTAADFTYDEETASITGWSESGHAKRKTLKTLVLPDQTPEGKDITVVGEAAFKIPDDEVEVTKFGIDSPGGMTSVSLPEKVAVIKKEAFSQNALTKVDFTGVTAIGERAFYGNDLVEAILPDTVSEMGEGAFATNDITSIRLSSNVTKIPSGAFSMNIRLSQIEIPDTVTEIGQTAFAGARLTSLEIPKSVTKIGYKAFHLHHLSSLVIPGNVKEIGESAFEGTYKATTLKTLVIEEGVESIGTRAFKEALLETVHFPESIKTVGDKPFENNKGKDGSHVVEVTTTNKAHRSLKDSTYVINYIGNIDMDEVKDQVKLSFTEADYTGKEIKPTVTIEGLEEGKDFTVSYKDNVRVGTASVVLTGKGRYVGSIAVNFEIVVPDDMTVVVNPSAPATKVDGFNKESIAEDVLTEEEKEEIFGGQETLDYQIYFEVERLSDIDVPQGDIIATNALAAGQEGFQKGMYLDFSLWKKIGNQPATKVSGVELSEKLTLTVELPSELLAPKGKVRTYYVIRVHDGVAELLPVTLNGKTISFESDKFSTYSVWYTESDASGKTDGVKPGTGNGSANTNGGSASKDNGLAAKTGDNNQMSLLCLLLVMSAAAFAGSIVYRRKRVR